MLVYTQRLVLRYDLIARGLNLLLGLLDRSNQAMLYIFSPEDTSGVEGAANRSQIKAGSGRHIPGMVKALFWIVFSISIASVVGRLG